MSDYNPHKNEIHHQSLSDALASGKLEPVRQLLQSLSESETGDLLESLPPGKRQVVWQLVDRNVSGEVLVHVNDEVRATLIENMNQADLIHATDGMDLDDLADIIEDLPNTVISEVLERMDQDDRERLTQVLAYPENSAGGLMNPDILTVRSDVTLDVVARYLRVRGELPELTDYLYVINRNSQYMGMLPLSALLTKDPQTKVADWIDCTVPGLSLDTPASEVAMKFEHHDWISAPVVDSSNRLVGRITIDDVVDVIREEAEHSVMSMAGMDEETDMFAPIFRSVRRRTVWLMFNALAAGLGAWAISQFTGTIEQYALLAVLMPIVASMGGIAGSQTLTLMIRAIALGQIGARNLGALLVRECAIGFLNGIIISCLIGAIAAFWAEKPELGMVIAGALIANLIVAALAGVVIPLLLKRLNIDPALAGGVVLISITDVVGFVAFLGLATLYLL